MKKENRSNSEGTMVQTKNGPVSLGILMKQYHENLPKHHLKRLRWRVRRTETSTTRAIDKKQMIYDEFDNLTLDPINNS